MLDFLSSRSTTAASPEAAGSAPPKHHPPINAHSFVFWRPDMQDDHDRDHVHDDLELSLGLSSRPPSIQKARLRSAAWADHLNQSTEQIWQCLQRKENAFREPASLRLVGDDCQPGIANEPHKGLSPYTRRPSVPLQFGSCNDLSCQVSATQLDRVLERDSESGQSLFQCEARQLNRKKELQAFKRQEARKRRRTLMEEKQKKARIYDHTASRQSEHFVAFELDKTSRFRDGSLQDFSKINNEETPQLACYVEQITGDNHPSGAKVHSRLFDSFTHGSEKKLQGEESSHGLRKFMRESMIGAAVQSNDEDTVSADQSAVEQYSMLSWGQKRACHTQTTPASTALPSIPHKVSNHLHVDVKTDYNDEYACNDEDESDIHLKCRSTSESIGDTRDVHSTSVQHNPNMQHHEATSKEIPSTVTSIGGSATCDPMSPSIIMATNTTGMYAQFSVWPAIPYPGAMTGAVHLQWGSPCFMQDPVPTGETSTAPSSGSLIGGHQIISSLEKSLSLFPLLPGAEPHPGDSNQHGRSRSEEPPAKDSNQHGNPTDAGISAKDEETYTKPELVPPVMTVVEMINSGKLLECVEPTLKCVEISMPAASELLQSNYWRTNDPPFSPLSRCSSAATQAQVNLPLEFRQHEPTEKQVLGRSSYNSNIQGHSSPSSTIESQSGGSCKDEKTHNEEAERGRPTSSNRGSRGNSKFHEISKVELMSAIIAGKPAKDLPRVSTTGAGPQGKTITGVMYIDEGNRVHLICSCHGEHMSPTEFVQHSGSSDLSNPEKSIKVNAVSSGNQLTATTGS